MSARPIVAVLGRGIVPADEPVLRADDPGVLGDGLFETLHVRDGRPWLRDEHLARLARSAQRIGLPLPPTDELAHLLDEVCAAGPAGQEGALRLVCTRGPAGAGPTIFASLTAVPAAVVHARRAGITVATLPLGVPATARASAQWPLAGMKSTSYGLSLAARRWAEGHGVDDALWTSTDGYALEGPTANLVWLDGATLCTVPAAVTGILPGVTAAWLLAHAAELGWVAEERMMTPEALRTVDGVWFTSSVRGLAEVRSLDGVPFPPSPHTAALRDLLGFPG
ncbi:MAG TPA: aminotransferase class IV [Micromonosporaceae bacterium]|nr:aminotransferase class IV [Micromonosporaceae bacterium]